MKKYILILFLFLSGSALSQSYLDSIPTVDNFGRVRNGIIVDSIVSVLNTDPSGVKLTEAEIAYIRSIVGGMYLAGSWQKCKAVYGLVGGNSWKHKWNWKDMRDLDAAYRLTFTGAVTHSSLGITISGLSNQYANTHFYPSSLTTGIHLSAYVQTLLSGTQIPIGVSENSSGLRISDIQTMIGSIAGEFYTTAYQGRVLPVPFTKGFAASSYSTSGFNLQANSYSATFAGGTPSFTNNPIYLLARNDVQQSGTFGSLKSPLSLATIGSQLTLQEMSATSHVVTYSQGILNRQ